MTCIEDKKVFFGTHMLSEKDKDWLDNACQILEVTCTEVTWVVFRMLFLESTSLRMCIVIRRLN